MSDKTKKTDRGFRLLERFSARRGSLFSWDLRILSGAKASPSALSRSFLRSNLLPRE